MWSPRGAATDISQAYGGDGDFKIIADSFTLPLLVTLHRQHVSGLSVNEVGGNIGLATHRINRDDAAFQLQELK